MKGIKIKRKFFYCVSLRSSQSKRTTVTENRRNLASVDDYAAGKRKFPFSLSSLSSSLHEMRKDGERRALVLFSSSKSNPAHYETECIVTEVEYFLRGGQR